MKILFSPSEQNAQGGDVPFLFNGSLLSGDASRDFVAAYEAVLQKGSAKEKRVLTGWKDADAVEVLPKVLEGSPGMPDLLRYTGVGFGYLDVEGLSAAARDYLLKNMVIFSNLFGPVRASDVIPETKLKQCARFVGVSIPGHYKAETSDWVDAYLGKGPVLDLRAGFYQGFYDVGVPRVTCAFEKSGKQVNHWSKAYRGVVARCVALHRPKSIRAFVALEIPGLVQTDVTETDGATHVMYRVED